MVAKRPADPGCSSLDEGSSSLPNETSQLFRPEAGGISLLQQGWKTLLAGHLQFCNPFRERRRRQEGGSMKETLPSTTQLENARVSSESWCEREITVTYFESPTDTGRYRVPDTPQEWRSTPGSGTISPLTSPRELQWATVTDLGSSRRRLFVSYPERKWKQRLLWIVGFCCLLPLCLKLFNCQRMAHQENTTLPELLEQSWSCMRRLSARTGSGKPVTRDTRNDTTIRIRTNLDNAQDTRPTRNSVLPLSTTTLLSLQGARLKHPRDCGIASEVDSTSGSLVYVKRSCEWSSPGVIVLRQLLKRLHWCIPLVLGGLVPGMQWVFVLAVISRAVLIGIESDRAIT